MDEAGFERIYDDHYEAVLRYCLRRTTRDLAADVAAETFVVAWRRRELVPSARPLPWLYAVAHRLLANQRRSLVRSARLDERLRGSGPVVADGPDDVLETDEEVQSVRRALGRLNDGDREIVRLAAWERLSRDDLAVVLGCSPNTATKRLSRALDRLAREVGVSRARGVRFLDGRGGVS